MSMRFFFGLAALLPCATGCPRALEALRAAGVEACAPPFENLDESDPGCIHDNLKSTLSGHVLILPGITGATQLIALDVGCTRFLEDGVDDVLDDETLLSGQIWDWTQDLPDNLLEILLLESDSSGALAARLLETEETQATAAKLARRLREWRWRNPDKPLSVIAGSGGAMILLLACSLDSASGQALLGDFEFDRVVLVSSALSATRSLAPLAARTGRGIYVYYSPVDATLQGYLSSGQEFEYAWQAVGRYGYGPLNPNANYVAGQLAWSENLPESLNNNGRHMNAYRKEFFKRYILPLLTADDAPGDWSGPRDHDNLLAVDSASAEAHETLTLPAGDADRAVVFLVPHEGKRDEDRLANLVEDHGAAAAVWDWTELPGVREQAPLLRITTPSGGQAAGVVADRLKQLAEAFSGPVTVVASSGGAVIGIAACDRLADEGVGKILDRVVFLSGAQSAERSLAGVSACTEGGIFNYYSSGNAFLMGDQFDRSGSNDGNCDEAMNDRFHVAVTNALPWPPAGRFGYRNSNLDYVTAQRGWDGVSDSGNDGQHLSERRAPYFDNEILPVLLGAPPPSAWQKGVLPRYEDDRVAPAYVPSAREAILDLIWSRS